MTAEIWPTFCLSIPVTENLGRLHREGDAVRRLDDHRVAAAEGELEVRPFCCTRVADAEDLHLVV